MAEIHALRGPLPHVPDDLTIVQFMLDHQHPTKPAVKQSSPWLIEDATGRKIGIDEVCMARTAVDDTICIRHLDISLAMSGF